METKGSNQLTNIANVLVGNLPKATLDACFEILVRYSRDSPMPQLFSFADKWSKAPASISMTELWEDFTKLISFHPELGFVIIEGKHIADIPSFYAEINRVYMADENWKIGSLDGFDDLLYGGFGKLQDAKKHSIIWKDIDDSRAALGMTTTLAYYQEKLAANSPFNQAYFQQKLIDLQSGKGQTYFDIVAEIIQSHLKIEWIHKTI
ncbi:hypothetical protein [Sphingobacterium prati]|uniref:hypothetical protein n=1 Tax=Sphingobacterium prati TaxID=2737006 RepID=UPI001FED0417|nr:hypothetical protein [Sphingobacterium prati]